MSATRKYAKVDPQGRVSLGKMARRDIYLVTVMPDGVITLTPAEVTALATPPLVRKRAPRKKAAAKPAAPTKETQS